MTKPIMTWSEARRLILDALSDDQRTKWLDLDGAGRRFYIELIMNNQMTVNQVLKILDIHGS